MATIRLLVSNSMHGVMDALLPRFRQATGHEIEVSYDPAKLMMERIARGEAADVAMLGGASLADLVKAGKVVAGSVRAVASCGVGIAVKAGATKPDIATVDRFKRALLDAKSVAWTQQGASGIYFSGLIGRLGIADALEARAVRVPGGLVGELVAAGRAELAVQQIPELMAVRGIDLAGPFPKEIQQITVTSAGVFAGSRAPAAARALLDFLATPDSKRIFRANGLEPTEG